MPPGATTIGARPARRAATAAAKRPSAIPTPMPVASAPASRAHRLDELPGQRLVAAEVARRAAGGEAQPARLDDLEARREAADRPHDGFERPGVAVGIVVEQRGVRAALLGLAATLADRDPSAAAAGDRATTRLACSTTPSAPAAHPGRDDRPVGAPHGDHPPVGSQGRGVRPSAHGAQHGLGDRERFGGGDGTRPDPAATARPGVAVGCAAPTTRR